MSGDTEVLNCTSICDYYQWCELAPVIYTSKLSVISINIRSLASKFAELCAQLTRTKNKFTFVVIVETWLTKEKDRALELQGLSLILFIEIIEWVVVSNFIILSI